MKLANLIYFDFAEIQDDLIKIKAIGGNASNTETISILKLFYIFLITHNNNEFKNKSFYDLFIDKMFIKKQSRIFFYYIYEQLETEKIIYKYSICNKLKFFLNSISKEYDIGNIKLSTLITTEEILSYEKDYNNLEKNEDLIKFYSRWEVVTLDNVRLPFNLSNIYSKYGRAFCESYYLAIKKIAASTIKTSFSRHVSNIYKLNKLFCENFSNLEQLKINLSSKNVHYIFHDFYNTLIIENLENKFCLINFHNRWRAYVDTYNLLIEYGLFEQPVYPILIPKFKNTRSISHHKVETGKIINDKLILNIPLSYSDSLAKEKIFQQINLNMKYIIDICELKCSEIKQKFDIFFELAADSAITHYYRDSNDARNICRKYLDLYYATSRVEDVVIKLGCNNKDLIYTLIPSLPQVDLYPFIVLLINEHPQITESWLTEWQLFKSGKQYGYIEGQGNESSYIISNKKRKGAKALQKIILNQNSLKIMKDILLITSLCREYLRAKGNLAYEYMLLVNNNIQSIPKQINKFYNPSTSSTKHQFNDLFYKKELLKLHPNLEAALNLADNFSLTKFRATRAVQIYLKTNSINEMANALGHETVDYRLINAYLPAPLWDYFTDRWIRIYQNSLIYEAMKDSPYLFEAVDIKTEELEEFFVNHHFGEIPEYLKQGKYKSIDEAIISNQLGVFTISIPLLQWFLAILNWVNRSNSQVSISSFAYKWYECAVLVISQLELSLSSEETKGFSLHLDEKILNMYQIAKKNPLMESTVARVLKC